MTDSSALDNAETELDRVTEELAVKLRENRGDQTAERAVIRDAIFRYEQIRVGAGKESEEGVIRFFTGDGVGLERARTPAILLIDDATDEEIERWTEMLSGAADMPAPSGEEDLDDNGDGSTDIDDAQIEGIQDDDDWGGEDEDDRDPPETPIEAAEQAVIEDRVESDGEADDGDDELEELEGEPTTISAAPDADEDEDDGDDEDGDDDEEDDDDTDDLEPMTEDVVVPEALSSEESNGEIKDAREQALEEVERAIEMTESAEADAITGKPEAAAKPKKAAKKSTKKKAAPKKAAKKSAKKAAPKKAAKAAGKKSSKKAAPKKAAKKSAKKAAPKKAAKAAGKKSSKKAAPKKAAKKSAKKVAPKKAAPKKAAGKKSAKKPAPKKVAKKSAPKKAAPKKAAKKAAPEKQTNHAITSQVEAATPSSDEGSAS